MWGKGAEGAAGEYSREGRKAVATPAMGGQEREAVSVGSYAWLRSRGLLFGWVWLRLGYGWRCLYLLDMGL